MPRISARSASSPSCVWSRRTPTYAVSVAPFGGLATPTPIADTACAPRVSPRVEQQHAGGGDHRGPAPARRPQRDHPTLAIHEVLDLRELLDVVGGVGDEQQPRGVDECVSFRTRPGHFAQDRLQLVLVAGVTVDAGARHHLGVVLAVAGDGSERDHRQPDGERLHARESTGVLDERVGRRHQRRHLVGPADDRPEARSSPARPAGCRRVHRR